MSIKAGTRQTHIDNQGISNKLILEFERIRYKAWISSIFLGIWSSLKHGDVCVVCWAGGLKDICKCWRGKSMSLPRIN